MRLGRGILKGLRPLGLGLFCTAGLAVLGARPIASFKSAEGEVMSDAQLERIRKDQNVSRINNVRGADCR
jgi:hypothetical protein